MSKILDLFAKNKYGVLSTISAEGKSQSAVVALTETDEYELIVGTSRNSRKYKNILLNPEVSVVIGWDNDTTVQYEGLARVLRGEEANECQKKHLAKHPESVVHREASDEVYILIKPTWIRYSNFSKHPSDIEEKDFS